VPANNRPTFLSELTLDQIKEGLQQTFPGLKLDLRQLKLLNDGFSSYVILVADEFILRIAKHAEAMAGHMKEQAILPLLQKHLPVQVPQPAWHADPSDLFPFGVTGYRRILGIPFSLSLVPHVKLNRIAQDLARFLVALHNVPTAEMIASGLRATHELESLQAEVMPTLHAYLKEDEYEKFRVWWERYLSNQIKDSFTPRLIHGDPWGENIILDETLNSVVGVVDFETLSIGDVAQDFAAQKYLGANFLRQVIEHYQALGGEPDHHFAIRLQDWSMLRELRGLRYAIKYPGSGELMDSLRKVRHELSLFA
jgi:aminoglycoside phosphotransferase (APT) family kinase protein